jgi:ADP-L-glycero-D-manno-heptose 6-epimerase
MNPESWQNLVGLKFKIVKYVHPLMAEDILVHLGARVNTKEKFSAELYRDNVSSSMELFGCGGQMGIRWKKIIYASSAAVYGREEKDFSERLDVKPINAYAFTKLQLDCEVENLKSCLPHNIYGLRFFNVYGPREEFKGDMKSVISKVLLKEMGYFDRNESGITLFKSDRPGVKDGEQKRDFVFVEDVCRVIKFFIDTDSQPGIYNVGSGKARSFNELAKAINPNIKTNYIDMPEDLKKQYQYFTQANLDKLSLQGYDVNSFKSLEYGIEKTREYYESKNS